MKKLTCKDCPFYTGVQCHGHGEFWGNCTLIDQAYKVLDMRSGPHRYVSTGFRDVCDDDSLCKFIAFNIFEVKKI